MALGFKIADGYVEVHADYDKSELRLAAQRAADGFDDSFQQRARRSDSGRAIADGINRDVVRSRSRFLQVGRTIARSIGDGINHKPTIGNAASSFFRTFIETVSFGQADIGGARPNTKIAKAMSAFGAGLGVILAGGLILKVAEAITAVSPLLLAALSIIPIKFLTKTDKAVKAAVKEFKRDWKSFMTDISEPIKPGFLKSLDAIRNRLDVLTPLVRTFFKTIGDALPKLTQGLMGGVYNFFDSMLLALPGINAGLREWGRQLPGLGRAFGEMFVTILSDTKLVEKAVQGFSSLLKGLMKIFANLVVGLTYVSASIGNFVRLIQIGFANSILPQWLSGVTQAWGPLRDAIVRAWEAFKKFATAEGDEEIVTRFRTLMQRIKEIWGPLKTFLGEVFKLGWDLVKQLWNTYVVPWFNSTVLPWLKQKGRELMKFMMDALEAEARARFIGLIASIPGLLAGLAAAIGVALTHAATVAKNKAKELVDGVVTFLKGLPGKAKAALSNLWGSISGAFTTATTRAKTAATNLVNGVVNFLKTLPGKARSAVSNLWGSMASTFSTAVSRAKTAATQLVNGFISIARTIVAKARQAVSGVRGAITGAFAGAGSWLVSAGRNIIGGLISGLQARLGELRSLAASIGALIKANKGPPSYDKIMLYENGQMIMQGLMRGIDSQRKPLASQLQGLSTTLPGMVRGEAAMAGAGAASGGGGFNPTINLYMQPGFYSENAAAKRALTKDVYLALEAYRKDYVSN